MNLSASGWSRMEEKEQLSQLNDRLVGYINVSFVNTSSLDFLSPPAQRVRSLEKENKRLSLTIVETEEIESRDRKTLENRYLQEIEDLRRALDHSAREVSELSIRNDGIDAEIEELRQQCVGACCVP